MGSGPHFQPTEIQLPTLKRRWPSTSRRHIHATLLPITPSESPLCSPHNTMSVSASARNKLFPTSLISSEAATSFPEGYTIRALERADYKKGFLECFKVLTDVGDVSEEQFNERYDWMAEHGRGIHFPLVIVHNGLVVGTGAVMVERKLYVAHSTFEQFFVILILDFSFCSPVF